MRRRRMGPMDSPTRALLIAAAETIMLRDGCAAVTARSLATAVGLKRQIVHYYFASIHELLALVIRKRADAVRLEIGKALAEADPFEAIWRVNGSPAVSATNYELNALALRNEIVRAEVRTQMNSLYRLQTDALTDYCRDAKIQPPVPIDVMVTMIAGVSQIAAVEKELGVPGAGNHGEVLRSAMRSFLIAPKKQEA